MPTIHWITHDGQRFSEDVAEGTHLMDAAVFAGVPGIEGDCGGNLSCATCHVVVDDACTACTGQPQPNEDTMLDVALQVPRQANSRLSCQIQVNAAMDGLVLHVPAPW